MVCWKAAATTEPLSSLLIVTSCGLRLPRTNPETVFRALEPSRTPFE